MGDIVIRSLDVSNYQSDVSAGQMARWWELGWEHLVVRGSLERQSMRDIAHRQLDLGADAGMSLAVYTWAYFTVDHPESFAADAVREYGRHQPLVYWIDCEDVDGYSYGEPNLNITWLHRALAAFDALGVRAGIYTGAWWWLPYMGGTHGFRERPLWDAAYNGNPSLEAPTYGGWERRRGHQYFGSGTGQVEGYALDLNVFDEEWLYGQEAPVNDVQMAEVQRIAQDEIIRNIEKALAQKRLPAEAREALTYGALPAAQTLARGEV